MKETCSCNLYENHNVDTTTQPLFFGCAKNTQRFDKVKYSFLDNLNTRMQSFFWRPEEIAMKKDKLDFNELCSEAEKFIFTTQLQKLVMLDSIQGRGPILTFSQLTTNPEFENCILTWEFFEGAIHSRSYSYNVEQVYSDPKEVFDKSWDNELLVKHAGTISDEYNKLYDMVIDYLAISRNDNYLDKIKSLFKEKSVSGFFKQMYNQFNLFFNKDAKDKFMHDLKKQLVLGLTNVNILEGIRFYPGFAAVWGITEFTGRLSGSSLILQLIARDENQHMALTQWLLNKLRKDELEGFTEIFKEVTPDIYDMYWKACEEECEWLDLLYSKGSVLGMNAEIGKQYIKFLTNQRLKAIGLRPIYPEINRNPIPWVEKWLEFSKIEGALQEEEAIDYKMGAINREMNEKDIKELLDFLLQ